MKVKDLNLAAILQISGNIIEHYHVPKYQREYTWGKNEWEQLLADISENDAGYFMGSIICVADSSDREQGASPIYEVIDGQQRLTTLSIVLMSIYCRILSLKDGLSSEDEEAKIAYQSALSQIEERLVYRKADVSGNESGWFEDNSRQKYCFLRVQPSTQNSNYADYLHILNELSLIEGDFFSKYRGVRRIYKAYNYFYGNLSGDYDSIKKMLDKVYSLTFVHIAVPSSADAFVLFESLNNRGIPLSAIDIIKNKMLARLETSHGMEIERAYEEWQRLLEYLPEYKEQERFLRHYYNAFKVDPDVKIEKFPRAIKSNLIKIYEERIKKDAKNLLNDLLVKAEIYHSFIDPDESGFSAAQKKLLLDLGRIGAASSHLFLLYMCSLSEESIADRNLAIDKILEFFLKYYVRRNITDFPNTRDLDTINIAVIEKCHERIGARNPLTADFVIEQFLGSKEGYSEIGSLKKALGDNLFANNAGMARFVLARLDETTHTKEFSRDLWQREKGALVWTVEHVFPQGKKIPQCWVDMIANGDKEKAQEIWNNYVHCLGNLTLSGYNPKLSNSEFEKKQNQRNAKGAAIGYKNGLYLNKLQFSVGGKMTSLSEIPRWTEDSIMARNDAMVDALLKEFAFSDEEFASLKKDDGA